MKQKKKKSNLSYFYEHEMNTNQKKKYMTNAALRRVKNALETKMYNNKINE